jgi:hypothetical protein
MRSSASTADLSESAWELRCGWIDTIFADGFESVSARASLQ